MSLLKSILCPIDFSEFSTKAYDYAQSLAWHYKAELLVQHVLYSLPPFIEDKAYMETCRKLRAEAERKVKGFVKHHTRTKVRPQCIVQDGTATDLILSLAEAQAVNLIVMGTHGLRGVDRLMLGSVTERVLRKAQCPVLAVRKPAHDFVSPGKEPDPVNIRKILLGMDFSDHAHRALDYALSMAREYGAELTLLHVLEHFPSSPDVQNTEAKAVKQLEECVPPEARAGCHIKPLLRIGKPYQQIIQLASEAQTDLAIMGVRGRTSLDSALFGSTAYRVIQLGPCPVLAVHI
jgi:nucleotide-binding universal stress UspA family protein